MKSLILFLFFTAVGYYGFGQQRNDYYMWPYGNNDKIEFSETVYLPKSNTDSLYILSKTFLSNKFNSERDSIVLRDNKRTAFCKGVFFIPIPQLGEKGNGYIGFTLTISSHNKSYRYTFTNFEHFSQQPDGPSGGALENDKPYNSKSPYPIRYWNEEKAKAYYYIQTTIESLKEYMAKHSG